MQVTTIRNGNKRKPNPATERLQTSDEPEQLVCTPLMPAGSCWLDMTLSSAQPQMVTTEFSCQSYPLRFTANLGASIMCSEE